MNVCFKTLDPREKEVAILGWGPVGSIRIHCSVSPQMSIESIERFLEQIVLDGGTGVQNLVKKMKESNCQKSLQAYLSKNYISRLPCLTTFNYVLNFNYFQLLLLHYY
jgi:hypothetical protein